MYWYNTNDKMITKEINNLVQYQCINNLLQKKIKTSSYKPHTYALISVDFFFGQGRAHTLI